MVLINTLLKRIRKFKVFSKVIDLKVNVIMRLKFELAYDNVTVQHTSNYITETLLSEIKVCSKDYH